MTREEWLCRAVEMIDSQIFAGDLDLLNHKYQINCGICPGKKLSNTIQPFDGEDVKLEDFFCTTISISHTIKDPIQILVNLTYECIHAFFNEKGCSKRFKKLAEKYYFDKPFKEPVPSTYLMDILKSIYKDLKELYGDWPGEAVVIHKEEKKDKKKSSYTVFCPECDYEMKVSAKMLEKHKGALPVCPCGCKMGLDLGEEELKDEE